MPQKPIVCRILYRRLCFRPPLKLANGCLDKTAPWQSAPPVRRKIALSKTWPGLSGIRLAQVNLIEGGDGQRLIMALQPVFQFGAVRYLAESPEGDDARRLRFHLINKLLKAAGERCRNGVVFATVEIDIRVQIRAVEQDEDFRPAVRVDTTIRAEDGGDLFGFAVLIG